MRIYLQIIILILAINTSCKTQETNNNLTGVAMDKEILGKTQGTVSHEFRKTGCSTVIRIKLKNADTLILIPLDFPDEFNKDGIKIHFNYRTLKMRNPDGCNEGIPASLSDISLI